MRSNEQLHSFGVKSRDFRVALLKNVSVDIYLSIYLCMDPGNPEVTMLKEPISDLHMHDFLARCHRTVHQNRYATISDLKTS